MKLMKKIKSSLIGIGLVIPIASVVGIVASCGKEETPPPAKTTFDAFTKAAETESLYKIVQQTKPDNDWLALDAHDLSRGDYSIIDQTVVVSITSTRKSQTAVFTAFYAVDTAYTIRAWACTGLPTATVTWDVFVRQVKKGGPQAVLDAIKIANPKGINIDLGSIESTSFTIDTNMKNFTVINNVSVSLALIFKPTEKILFVNRKTINITINFNHHAYDATNWTAPDYTFADFKNDAQASVSTDAWKKFALEKSHWTNDDYKFNELLGDQTTGLTVTIDNQTTLQAVTLTLKFHSANNKVWIYGEQMGNGNPDGAWKINTPFTKGWDKKAQDFVNRITNTQDKKDKNLLFNVLYINSEDNYRKLHGFLNTNKDANSPVTAYTWNNLRVVISDFKYVAEHNSSPAYDNTYGSEEFKMVFYHANTSNKKPLTSGGMFHLNRDSATSMPTNPKKDYKNCSCFEDITII